jgi:hypothetical protein
MLISIIYAMPADLILHFLLSICLGELVRKLGDDKLNLFGRQELWELIRLRDLSKLSEDPNQSLISHVITQSETELQDSGFRVDQIGQYALDRL